jgi:hypothetical protein
MLLLGVGVAAMAIVLEMREAKLLARRTQSPAHHYCVGREFAVFLGPRHIIDGNASGEAFRAVILSLLDKYPRIRLDFTRCRGGCSAAWFDEAFGKLSDHGYRSYEVFDRIEVVTDQPSDILLISEYIHPEIHRNDDIYREIAPRVFESTWKMSDGIV